MCRISARSGYKWSWKLASLGIPVVLMYVGFLNAREMQDAGEPLHSYDDWTNKMRSYCVDTVDKTCWNKRLDVDGTPLLPLLRVVEQPFEPLNP